MVTLGELAVRGVWMGSEGDPSELSEETEPERYLCCAAAVLIGRGLEWGILSVLLLSMASEIQRMREGEEEEADSLDPRL